MRWPFALAPAWSLAALVGATAIARAGEPSSSPRFEIAAVDFQAIPLAELPPRPAEKAPPSVPAGESLMEGLVFTADQEPARPKPRAKRLPHRVGPKGKVRPRPASTAKGKPRVLRLEDPDRGVLFLLSAEDAPTAIDAVEGIPCGKDDDGVVPVRWETVAIEPSGEARLDVTDFWFDIKRCGVAKIGASAVRFRPIVGKGGRSFLFALRSESSVTLLMPKASELSAETTVGAARTLKGSFSRVTLPLGRWGVASVAATLPELEVGSRPADEADGETKEPAELAVELVQTVSEPTPTMIVRAKVPAEPERVAGQSSETRGARE